MGRGACINGMDLKLGIVADRFHVLRPHVLHLPKCWLLAALEMFLALWGVESSRVPTVSQARETTREPKPRQQSSLHANSEVSAKEAAAYPKYPFRYSAWGSEFRVQGLGFGVSAG